MSKKKKVESEFEPKVIEKDGEDFVAFIPNQIEADDGFDAALEGFPLNILFAAITKDAKTGQQSLVDVCYEPAPDTFREDAQRKVMCYVAKPNNGYFVRVVFVKKTKCWETEKFNGKRLFLSAYGPTFDGAMMQTTMVAPEPGEYLKVV